MLNQKNHMEYQQSAVIASQELHGIALLVECLMRAGPMGRQHLRHNCGYIYIYIYISISYWYIYGIIWIYIYVNICGIMLCPVNGEIYIYIWLVGLLPLWKIWVRQFGWWHFHIFWENKIHVPNHESVYSEISSIVTEISSMIIGQLGKFIFINIYIYIYMYYIPMVIGYCTKPLTHRPTFHSENLGCFCCFQATWSAPVPAPR